jgi:glycosyltransferase involved in cell wall biosynthesis
MHVAVDGRALRGGTARARGVGRYLQCLLEELRRAFPQDEYTLVDPGRARLASAALVRRPRLDRLVPGCDMVWVPAPAPVAVSRDTPYVLTVHDLSFEHRPGDYSAYERLWHRIARPARLASAAERVLCVSEATWHAAVDEWGLDGDRVRTVLSGPGRPPGRGALAPSMPDAFVLAVGALEPRKLPQLLAEAHRRARAEGLGAELVFAGDGPLRGELEGTGATVLGHVPDALLDTLYEGALAVACVSREEGFGFTPLEALTRGTPVIVADLPVFAETLGDGALRVPPGDAGALAHALLRLEREPGLRERLIQAGGEAVSALSWERTARETRAVFEEAAGR